MVSTFMLASCCNTTPTNSDNSFVEVDNFTYTMYRFKLDNHTYIMLAVGYRMGFTHDPECSYCKEHNSCFDNDFPEHKLETTDY